MKLFLTTISLFTRGMILGLCILVMTNAVAIENGYFNKYNNAYAKIEREQARQQLVSRMMASQESWVRSNNAITQAYQDERALRVQIERRSETQAYEMYAFLRMLENTNPGLIDEIMEMLGQRRPDIYWDKTTPKPEKKKDIEA